VTFFYREVASVETRGVGGAQVGVGEVGRPVFIELAVQPQLKPAALGAAGVLVAGAAVLVGEDDDFIISVDLEQRRVDARALAKQGFQAGFVLGAGGRVQIQVGAAVGAGRVGKFALGGCLE